ncbi:AcrR family transcriptional regulator [Gordonia amarae]|nr:TetR/AcrR family transcriptional regulator [Gordonia amarae]MCS3877612.1 AcrR family transcriptional regulator [Gordonia amarae]
MPDRQSARDRMLASATAVLAESGPSGVTIDRVLSDSGAPRGSVYHHFPGGRTEIITRAGQSAAEKAIGRYRELAADNDTAGLVDALVDRWKRNLIDHDFRRGCPILALAVDDLSAVPELDGDIADTFVTWRTIAARVLERDGVPAPRSERLATLIVTAVEGAVAMCRSTRSIVPLDDVAAELRALVETALHRPD